VDWGALGLLAFVVACQPLGGLGLGHQLTERGWPVRLFGLTLVWERYGLNYLQLMVVVGLTADGGRSLLGRLLRWRVASFLGRISMSLYLLHVPVLYYAMAAQHLVHHPWCGDCGSATLGLCALASLGLAALATLLVEEPMRRLLQARSGSK
jgi:peptidoglycan/LPS O-acetylase OafA/YrhL